MFTQICSKKFKVDKIRSYQCETNIYIDGKRVSRTNDYYEYAKQIRAGIDYKNKFNKESYYSISYDFYFKGGNDNEFCTKHIDIDNMIKLLNDIIFYGSNADDCQIVGLQSSKRWSGNENSYIKITIWENKKQEVK